jgi:hypothetical protein
MTVQDPGPLKDDDCQICGNCWWTDCTNPADYEFDVFLKRHGNPVYDGTVDLCAGHARRAAATGNVNVSWGALEQALARQKVRM